MKKETKKTLLISGGIIGTLAIAAALYYFLVYKKEDEEVKPVIDAGEGVKAMFTSASTIEDENKTNNLAMRLLQAKRAELERKRAVNKIILANGGSMNQNALDNQMMQEEAARIAAETGVNIYVKPKDITTGNTVYAA